MYLFCTVCAGFKPSLWLLPFRSLTFVSSHTCKETVSLSASIPQLSHPLSTSCTADQKTRTAEHSKPPAPPVLPVTASQELQHGFCLKAPHFRPVLATQCPSATLSISSPTWRALALSTGMTPCRSSCSSLTSTPDTDHSRNMLTLPRSRDSPLAPCQPHQQKEAEDSISSEPL